ncbi:MAG: hypothetical protein R3308_00665 [Thiohalobacterales bacterium]|nr:hypothetical protein [Thiohalobacterales bacterium]
MTRHVLKILLAGLLLAAHPAFSGDLRPVIPEAQARFSPEQGCVEPVEDMRKNHMEYILHQRDRTMYDGIRTKQHSLNECINCHVSDAADAPRYESEEHFCNSCHSYAAVRIDCFQCHADRPVSTPQQQSQAGNMKHPHATQDSLPPHQPTARIQQLLATGGKSE